VLLAAFAAQVGERKLDGGVGLEDAQAGHAVEVLLPATPAITGSARVEQGVPRQPKEAVKISQDHLGLVIVRVAGVGRHPPSDRTELLAEVDDGAPVRLGGHGRQWRQRLPEDQDVDQQVARQFGQRRLGGEPADHRLVLRHGRRCG
jgi:hypothetical protein